MIQIYKTRLQCFSIGMLMLFIASGPSLAFERVEQMFEATVELSSRTPAAEQQAIREALALVMTRVSGNPEVKVWPQTSDLLKNARNFVVEYGVSTIDKVLEDGISITRTEALWVRFDQQRLEPLLQNAQIPVWSAYRPKVVVWLVTETGEGEHHLMPPDAQPAADIALRALARDRGIPLAIPAYSDEEQGLFPAIAAWEFDPEYLRQISQKYASDIHSVIRFKWLETGQLEGASFFLFDDQSYFFEGVAASVPELVVNQMKQFVDLYASQHSFVTNAQGGMVKLNIFGVRDYESFNRIKKKLEQLEMIREPRVVSISGDKVQFQADISSRSELLVNAITQSTGLQFADSSEIASVEAMPVYNFYFPNLIPEQKPFEVQSLETGGQSQFPQSE